MERRNTAAARIQAGFQSTPADEEKGGLQFARVMPFSHEAYAGDLSLIAADQCVQIALQRFTYILLKIR